MGERASIYGRQSSNKAKSIEEQLGAGQQAVTDQGWTLAGSYSDGSSASRYASKVRGDWTRLLADIADGSFDVLVLWESSRGDRTLETWAAFLGLCRKHHVRLHVITHDRTYDLSNARDWKTLAEDGVASAYESELLSVRVKRGNAGAAAAGKPAGGPAPYGYRRSYDPNTGKATGQKVFESEARVVREIVERVATGHTILGIANDLNRRGIVCAATELWTPAAIRRMTRNRSYVGLRVHNGTEYPAAWEAIVSEEMFYAAQRVLSDPGRRITRPGRQKHLLSFLSTCAPCGRYQNAIKGDYRCVAGCVSVPKDVAEETVIRHVIGRLCEPDAINALADNNDGAAEKARGEAAKLRDRLSQWRASAGRGETSPESLAVIETDLTEQIRVADQAATKASLPIALRDMLDPAADVRDRWESASLISRRAVIKALCEVKVGPGTPGRRSTYTRLAPSRWIGDHKTWGDYWA